MLTWANICWNMLAYAVLSNILQYDHILSNILQYDHILFNIVKYSIVYDNIVKYSIIYDHIVTYSIIYDNTLWFLQIAQRALLHLQFLRLQRHHIAEVFPLSFCFLLFGWGGDIGVGHITWFLLQFRHGALRRRDGRELAVVAQPLGHLWAFLSYGGWGCVIDARHVANCPH